MDDPGAAREARLPGWILPLSEERAPGCDHQRVRYRAGAYASGLVACMSADPAHSPSEQRPTPVGKWKAAKPQVHQTEHRRRDGQRGRAVAGEIFDPLLQDAAEE